VLLRAREVQGLLVMLAPQAMIDATDVARVLSEQLRDANIPVLTSWLGGVDVEKGRELFNRAGIATFDTPERAVRAFINLHRHARDIDMLQQIPPRLSARIRVDREAAGRLVETGLKSAKGLLTETEAKTLIAAYGIPVNPTTAAASADEAGSIAKEYGFPVAMKILSREIIHKSDAGGVALNLKTADEVKKTFTASSLP
jgi:acetyltransferase